MFVVKSQLIIILFLILILSFFCTKKEEEGQQKAIEEEEFTISSSMEGQAQRININYDSLLIVVDNLTEMVTKYPTDIDLRKKLVFTCYDTANNIILASGRGTPLITARTPTLAMNYAHKAAVIQAYRWAAYLREWRLDPTTPDLDKISGDLPSGRVVSKNILPDSTVQVLVEVNIGTMP
jgi:hypothetical protein